MEYIVVPFAANIASTGNAKAASDQLEQLIRANATNGYEFYSLEDITTNVAPSDGCFGFGAKPGYTTTVQCIVLKKQ